MGSPNLDLNIQTTGSNNGTWGIVLNADLTIIDNRFGSPVTVDCSGSSDIVVSTSQAQNIAQLLTGTLTGNINYKMPVAGGFYIVNNATTGAFTVKVIVTGGTTGVTIPQGSSCLVFCNANATTVSAVLSYLPSLTVDAVSTAALTVTGTTSFPVGSINSAAIASLPSNPIPVGTVMDFAGSSTPGGFLLCFGQTVLVATYPALAAVLGTTYGGDGVTTFGIPDCRGRIGAGLDNMGGTPANRLTGSTYGVDGSTLGAVGGEQNHTIVTTEMAAHTHDNGSLVTSTAGDHQHTANSGNTGFTGSVFLQTSGSVGTLTTNTAGAHNHSITGSMGSVGGNTGHNNVQPTIIFNKIIKT
jgi:microcystin-dependent protein